MLMSFIDGHLCDSGASRSIKNDEMMNEDEEKAFTEFLASQKLKFSIVIQSCMAKGIGFEVKSGRGI